MDRQLKDLIQSDVKRYYSGGTPIVWKLLNPNLEHIIIYRKAHFYSSRNKLLYYFYVYKLKNLVKSMLFRFL